MGNYNTVSFWIDPRWEILIFSGMSSVVSYDIMHVKIKRQGGVLSGKREVKEKLYESLSGEKWPAACEYCRIWPAWLLFS